MGGAVLYDIIDMQPTNFDKKSESSTTATTQDAIGDIHEDSDAVGQSVKSDTIPTEGIVLQDADSVNSEFAPVKDGGVSYSFGVIQEDINNHVEAAYNIIKLPFLSIITEILRQFIMWAK